MSFLLEALRKSENEKRIGNVPTIHTATGLEEPSRRHRATGLALLVLLPAGMVLGWFAWQEYRQKDVVGVTQAAPVAEVTSEPADELPPERPGPLPEIPRPPDSAASRPGSGRTPVESFVAGVEPSVEQAQESGDTPTEVIVAEQASAVPPDDGASEYHAPRPSPVRFWNLPQSMREELQDPRISVLVFSETPADRFILLNGRRQVEGDEVQPGLVLEEIRRDGALFSFRNYQFLISQ
jgi:general secretion pathway protein B